MGHGSTRATCIAARLLHTRITSKRLTTPSLPPWLHSNGEQHEPAGEKTSEPYSIRSLLLGEGETALQQFEYRAGSYQRYETKLSLKHLCTLR